MEDLQAQMNAILQNPQMMQTIMNLAQGMGQSPPPPSNEPETPTPQNGPDPAMLQKLSGIAGQSQIDSNQKNLLQALGPYLNRDRVGRLERAMRAARIAQIASSFLGKQNF